MNIIFHLMLFFNPVYVKKTVVYQKKNVPFFWRLISDAACERVWAASDEDNGQFQESRYEQISPISAAIYCAST